MQPPAKRSRAFAMSSRVGEHRHADRVDARQRRAHQLLDQVDVVDHQIEHHVDVGAARLERREPMGLDEQRPVEHVGQRQQRRALKRSRWPTWRIRAARRGERDQRIGLGRGVAAIGFSTSTCRPASSSRLATAQCAAVGTATLAASTLPSSAAASLSASDPEALRQRLRGGRVAIDHRDQLHIRQRGVFLGMKAPEMPAADDRDPDRAHRREVDRAGRLSGTAAIPGLARQRLPPPRSAGKRGRGLRPARAPPAGSRAALTIAAITLAGW